MAVASGTANAMHPETGHIEMDIMEQLLPQIKVSALGG
jgi:fructose-1-phosphate kinase PfkB-like protein